MCDRHRIGEHPFSCQSVDRHNTLDFAMQNRVQKWLAAPFETPPQPIKMIHSVSVQNVFFIGSRQRTV